MYCPHCGNQIANNAKFCTICGATMNDNGNAQQNNYQQQPNYQQPYGGYGQPNGYTAPGGYKVPIKKRSIALAIILSVVTCGIYGIYWFVCLVNDLNAASGRNGDTSGGMVFLLSLVTCSIYMWVWMYKAGEKVNVVKQRNGYPSDSNSGIIYLLLSLFGLSIVAECLIQSELNNVATIE